MHTYINKVQFVLCIGTNADGEEQYISLQPRHLGARVLETNTWIGHDDDDGQTVDRM